MPVTKSAEKQMRKSIAAYKRNKVVKESYRTKVKAVKKNITSNPKQAEKEIAEAISLIDKAAKRGVIQKGTAKRKKSRLTKSLNKSLGKPAEMKTFREKKAVEKVAKPKAGSKKAPTKKTTKKKA